MNHLQDSLDYILNYAAARYALMMTMIDLNLDNDGMLTLLASKDWHTIVPLLMRHLSHLRDKPLEFDIDVAKLIALNDICNDNA